ncbi:unnamed protein product [Diatraea saccharalis]|uniref:Uncharacterized protein n=1 Tax=Diatraea saccharalis TaxID=40085 RepID=A0A9N9RBK6_9NEOP|nr:unnamed protein product [Diatraea saccharalis]
MVSLSVEVCSSTNMNFRPNHNRPAIVGIDFLRVLQAAHTKNSPYAYSSRIRMKTESGLIVDYDCSPIMPKEEETQIPKSTKPLPSYAVMKSTSKLPESVSVVETIRPYKRLRTTPTLPPPSTTTNDEVEETTTAAPTDSTPLTNATTAPYINYQCQQPCSNVFENYGRVCAQRYNGIKYEYKEFEDICDMIDNNCMHHGTLVTKQDPENYRGPWYVIIRGPCYLLYTPFPQPQTNGTKLLQRVEQYMTIDFELYRTRGFE